MKIYFYSLSGKIVSAFSKITLIILTLIPVEEKSTSGQISLLPINVGPNTTAKFLIFIKLTLAYSLTLIKCFVMYFNVL